MSNNYTVTEVVEPQKDRAKRCARIYYMMLTTDTVKPTIGKAMVLAGYKQSTSERMAKRTVNSLAFKQEMLRLEELHGFNLQKGLEIVRNKGVKNLLDRDFSKERMQNVVQAVAVTNEQLRLERGLSTQNISMAQFLQELNKTDETKPDEQSNQG